MENQITFRASAGDEMQDLPPVLMWADMCRSGAGSRAANMSKKLSETQTEKRVAYEVSVSKIDFLEELD